MAISQIVSDSIAPNSISSNVILSVSNTAITGLINANQISSIANTQITGAITSAQIVSVANTAITGNINSSQITSVANTQLTGVVTSNQLAPTAQHIGFKNRIINGAMVIDQRNAGASVTATNAAENFVVDRFPVYASQASKFTAQQNAGSVTPPAGFNYYIGMTSSSAYSVLANDYFYLYQKIEGFNTADLGFGTANAKTITISAWVRSSLTGTFSGSVTNNNLSRSYPFTYSISVANTWTQISVTIPGDTSGTWIGATNGTGMILYWNMGAGTNLSGTAGVWASASYTAATGSVSVVGTSGATFYITGVQLEVGSQATSFDFRDYGRELLLCQRYYESNYNLGVAAGTSSLESSCGTYIAAIDVSGLYGSIYFKAYKRVTPTMTIYSYNGTAGKTSPVQNTATSGNGTVAAFRYGQAGFGAIGDSGNGFTAGTLYWIGWTASAEL